MLERPSRLVERGVAVWGEVSSPYTPQASARVRRFRDGEITTVFEGATSIGVPELRNGHVLWLAFGDDRTLWLAPSDGPPNAIARGAIEDVALGDDAAWWTEGGAVMRHDFASGANQRAHDGPCGLLVADGHRAAAVCGPDSGPGYFATRTGELSVFEGRNAFAVSTRGGESIAGLSLFEGRIAWVEYPADVGCGVSGVATGELVIAALARPDVSSVAATVLAGCWCCDAYWPALQLSLSTAGVAWNYPRPAGEVEPFYAARDAVGWGLFTAPACR